MLFNRVPTPRCAFELHFGLFKIKTMKKETLEEALNNYIAKKHTQEECVGFIDGFQLAKEKTIEEVFEWLTTNNYLTDLKETLIENFKNR